METPAPPLNEKLLSSAGGWAAMKIARELVTAGRVSGAVYQPPLLTGEVREGQKRYRAGLRVRSASDVENLCTCREAREWGKICAHSLAVGLACLAPPEKKPAPRAESSPNEPARNSRWVAVGESEARSVKLHFILPPNFPAAWSKGQILVCLEAQDQSRRTNLDAFPRDERLACDEFDLTALQSLGKEVTGANWLSAEEFLRWLPSLRAHPRITFAKSNPARVLSEPFRPRIILSATRQNFTLASALSREEAPLVSGADAWVLRGRDFLEIGNQLPAGLTNALMQAHTLSAGRLDEFLAMELPLWREFAEVELPPEVPLPAVENALPEFSLAFEGSLQNLRANLRCRYGERPALRPLADPGERFVLRDPVKQRLQVRDLEAERAAVALLERAGFSATPEGFELRDSGRIVRFFAFDFPALPKSWEVSLSPRLEKANNELEPISPVLEITRSGEDWFELNYAMSSSGGEGVALPEVQRLLRSGRSQTRLTNGKIGVFDPAALEDFEQVLRDADPRQSQPGVYRLSKIQAGYLALTAEEIGARLRGAAQLLERPKAVPALGSLERQLRDYQREGVRWLAALAAQNLGGILADEMGLGKTVQTLAFLALERGRGPALIVCPTSLLSNWQREAARFTPDLKVLRIDGPERAQKIARLPKYDLGLTSYGLLRRDAELYLGGEFSSVVLDEAQHIKNPETQNAQAAFSLRARHRLVLTGTPMENSVRDLWSLMNFVAPGYLGSRTDFRERYERPLTTSADPVLQRRLSRRVRPFLLRRRKQEVARELPEKIEQVLPCDLGQGQRAIYRGLLEEIQRGLGAATPSDGARRMKMLTGLLRLRQTCCDLRLLDSATRENEPSAKLDLLDELLGEIVDGGHRVLIFSQFVRMLDLLRERLDERGLPLCYLAGQTRHRQEEVDRFQDDDSIPVFLISLKAGGVGLNLSAADTVIHFDPWWNAAVEAQATDRAHRLGQKRVVTVYKLIARDTVEEKILNLQKRKREMASAMLEGETPLMSGLSDDELTELLAN